MTLNQLEYFCAVCRYHSITRAAESLFVSQPTISASIRNLEKEFHLRLFTHGQNRITLTNDGSLFYKKAEYILHRAHEMYTDFSDKDTNKAPLRIGITSTPSALLLPSLAMEFEEKYGIPVKLMECSSMHARELVDNDELDVAIANLDFYNLDNYDYHTVIEDTYVYCVDKNHHLAKEPSVSFETLKEEPIILFNTDSVQSHTVITGFRSEGATPHIKMYSSGAMNSTMNNSGSSVTSGKNGSCDANAPNAICTSGVDTLGMNRLRNEDSTTAAMMHRINSNTANVPPLRVFPTFSSLPRGGYERVSPWADVRAASVGCAGRTCGPVVRSGRMAAATLWRMRWNDDMELEVALAREAAADGEVPVGAVVLAADGQVIGRGRNLRETHADPLAHAEVKAMAEAAASLGTWNLADCTLVVTLEPCPMCAGACLQTHIGRIVFGAWDAKLGACGSVWDIPRDPHVGLVPEVIGGVREAECGRLMTDFFARRR